MKWTEFKDLLDQHLKDEVISEEKRISIEGPHSTYKFKKVSTDLTNLYKELIKELSISTNSTELLDIKNKPEFQSAFLEVESFFQENNLDIPEDYETYSKYCEAILKMKKNYLMKIGISNNSAWGFNKGFSFMSNTSEISDSHCDSILLSEAVKKFINERSQEGSWRDKTKLEYEASLRLFIKVVTDSPISTVDKEVARFYKEVLMDLPSNMNKKALYKGKTIDQIRKMTIPKEHKLSVSKINAYITQASSLFNWAISNLDVESNPFSGLKLQDKVAGQDKRLPFTDADLKAIFNAIEFKTNKRRHPYYYWLPLLGLYTGARIEELCQLYLEDIYEKDGVWVIDMNDNHDKKLKNSSSHRIIPIHSKLLGLGFLEYIAILKKKKANRLFDELNKRRDGYSQSAVNWFSRFWKRLPLDHTRKSFHSFRHTAIDRLKQKGIPREQLVALSGHKDESMATGWYGKAYDPKVLVPVVEALDFDIDVLPYVKLSD